MAPEIAALDLEAAAGTIREALREGPRTRDELVALVGKDAWRGADVDLVRVPPSGTWERRRADLYGLAEEWLGPSNATPEQGVELLVRRYLGAFGPARAADIGQWSGLPTAAVKTAAVKTALGRLAVRHFRDEAGRELVDLPRAPLLDPDTPAPPRFIATWDAMLLVHARRAGVLPEEFRPIVFNTKLPFSMMTFLLDGAVAGSWRYEAGRIRLDPFRRLTQAELRELDTEAERLAAFHA